MHVVFRESHGLEETATPVDLGQDPADLVVLSFSDSDLGAFSAGWHRAAGGLPSLRLANLAALQHPLSVDTYVERTLSGAKGILIRLIGGVPYWSYGLQQVEALARANGIALAVLPADGRPDPRLDAVSTLPVSTLQRLTSLCDAGGAVAAQAALAQMALATGLYAGPVAGAKTLPEVGAWTPEAGVCDPAGFVATRPLILITFYRAWLTAHDMAPVEALFSAFRARGFDVLGLFAPSLKAPNAAPWISDWVTRLVPAAIVNSTSFSARGEAGNTPLDAAEVPVFQIALGTASQQAWAASPRGLSPSDLAMHVVLPEVDGRIFAGIASFKQAAPRDPDLQFARLAHQPDPARIAAIADRVAGWVRLAVLDAAEKQVALVLSTYPGKTHQMAHAVGLDALASAETMLADMGEAGHRTAPGEPLAKALAEEELSWPVAEYQAALCSLAPEIRDSLTSAWGAPEADPAVIDHHFRFKATRRSNVLVALQPERGEVAGRDAEYHDLSRTPRHAYVAFYLWLRRSVGIHALVHIGAHGTLEWLPGKSVALSDACWPEALTGDLPVIYPFIVNDPGEAAQAKRRIGAVTIGHVPPALRATGTTERLARLEALLDEFSNADGLDPKRRDRLQQDIRAEAAAAGVEADLGLDGAASVAEAITRIDRFVCDVKESQFGDGLHIFGRTSLHSMPGAEVSAEAERQALLDALAGRRIAPGPSGSPYRGRADVLPTGRNLYTTDPRSVPSRAAYAQGVKLAEELVRRHLQDHGDYPRGLVIDLWGSATMRTAGEEFAMALHLLGAKPVWDEGSDRVSGVEILPIAMLDRARIDVTLRVSGLFRDIFPTLSALFGQAVRALSGRDEASDWNPYAGRDVGARVYGPAPAHYGLAMGGAAEDYTDAARTHAGEAWLHASGWALDGVEPVADDQGIAARVAQAEAFVHLQDLPETDVLLAADYAAHEAGFAAAKALTGGSAALYHLDSTDPVRPKARPLREEIARVVRARAAHPSWIAGMMRHGFRGGAEIAATLDHLGAFAHLAGVVEPHLIDLYHDATLGDDAVRDFLARENPGALAAMQARFAALHAAGLWQTRRNSILAGLEATR
ncbi:MAG: cobaltochelatase subunit CobN [Cereibacter sphaeroides]|uniref:Cobaltochelatase subunit CobN n=1 Tax=Cereibacter sphaeroides TaxID=1063 RepID=A0A2W5SBE8_CERSP|nr:MAG: cobaltochelatase subunit CobN [Cereibacter sphaeroides]